MVEDSSHENLGEVVFVEEGALQQLSLHETAAGKDADTAGSIGKQVLVLCDHACSRIPSVMGNVAEEILLDHYGWDIGALSVARVLARELSSSLIYSNFSRLLIDPNRGKGAKDLIREDLSIPLNARIDATKRAQRIASFYDPYHKTIDDFLDCSTGVIFIISVHTFTPCLGGEVRAWDTGLIYDVERPADALCAKFFMNFLRKESLLVGDNQPYPPLLDDSLARHATSRDLVGVGIEIRNDLVREARGQEEWGARLARGVRGWLNTS